MKDIFILLAPVFLLIGCTEQKQVESNELNFGNIDHIYSEILHEERTVYVHVPDNTKNSTNEKHPVLYLLDGRAFFHPVGGMIQTLSHPSNIVLPKMIIVAITNEHRNRDLTHTKGGVKFQQFIGKELIPYIEKKYPAGTHRTIMGHSRGGLFVINTMLDAPQLFNNYLAIDPSLFDGNNVLFRADSVIASSEYLGKSLFVGIANTEQMELEKALDKNGDVYPHTRTIWEFCQSRAKDSISGLNFGWKYYPTNSHHDSTVPGSYDGLRFLFSYHEFKRIRHFFSFVEKEISSEEFMTKIIDHFDIISKEFGYDVLPYEAFIKKYGFLSKSENQIDLAKELFEMNLKNFPLSSDAQYNMGEFFLSQKDTVKAIEFYRKSVQLEDHNFANERLKTFESNITAKSH